LPSQAPRTFKSSRAFLIRSADRGEVDLRISFFTETDGLVTLIAKSALRSRKRFGGNLQKYFLLQIEWTEIPGRMGLLNSVSLLASYWEIVADWEKVRHADYLLELAAAIFPQPGPKPKVFRILVAEMISLAGGENPPAVARKAEAAFLSMAGWGPDLSGCRRCGVPPGLKEKKTADPIRFLVSEGRFLCGSCARTGGHSMSQGAARTWKALQSTSAPLLRRLRISNNILEELQIVMSEYLELHLGKSFRSLGGSSDGK
jgi:DNA repair protein RecO (recombination protein O)